MKTYYSMILVGSSLVLGLSGCSDPNAPANDLRSGTNTMTTPSSSQGAGGMTTSTQRVGSEVGYGVGAGQAQGQVAPAEGQQAVTDAGAGMQAQFNAVVDDVKKLIAEGKGSEAVQKITTTLGSWQLTPEQERVLNDLRQQAQALLSREGVNAAGQAAGQAAGNLLPTRPQN